MERVFISYRRKTSKYAALLVYKDLTLKGCDVFIDYESIDSGKFESEIYRQIASRYHFVVILSPGCLERTKVQEDWFRKEIEYAIDMERNIVPLMFDGFMFGNFEQCDTGKLHNLSSYNGVNVPDGYFDEAMAKLKQRFLKQPAQGIEKAMPEKDQMAIEKIMQKARNAANQDDFLSATFRYTGNPPTTNRKITPHLAPKSQNPKKRDGFPITATIKNLGQTPIKDEQIFLEENANKDIGFNSFHKGKIIITDKRLIFVDLIDGKYSFEIPMRELRNAKYKKSNFFDYFTIHLSDRKKFTLVVVGAEKKNRIEKMINELAGKYST